MTQKDKIPSLPPKSKEELEADAALVAACQSADDASKKLEHTTACLKRTISDAKLKAVKFPTPSMLDLDKKEA